MSISKILSEWYVDNVLLFAAWDDWDTSDFHQSLRVVKKYEDKIEEPQYSDQRKYRKFLSLKKDDNKDPGTKYYSDIGIAYAEPEEIGYGHIDCLPHLIGTKWNTRALNYVNALRPSSIRVTAGSLKANGQLWRVTVIVDTDNNILEITQEVQVGCVGYAHAEDLDNDIKQL